MLDDDPRIHVVNGWYIDSVSEFLSLNLCLRFYFLASPFLSLISQPGNAFTPLHNPL